MKYAAFPLTILLALALWAASPVGRAGDPHLSVRYIQNSASETGMGSPRWAVAGDYRSFDLFLLPFLFLAAGALLFASQDQPFLAFASRIGFLLILAGAVLASLTAWGGMSEYGNFLDFGFLTRWVPPEAARGRGAFLLGLAAACGFLGLLAAVRGCREPKGGIHGN